MLFYVTYNAEYWSEEYSMQRLKSYLKIKIKKIYIPSPAALLTITFLVITIPSLFGEPLHTQNQDHWHFGIQQIIGEQRGLTYGLEQKGNQCFGMQSIDGRTQQWYRIEPTFCARFIHLVSIFSKELARQELPPSEIKFGIATPDSLIKWNDLNFAGNMYSESLCGTPIQCAAEKIKPQERLAYELKIQLFQALGEIELLNESESIE